MQGQCLLVNAPGSADPEQLEEVGLQVTDKAKKRIMEHRGGTYTI